MCTMRPQPTTNRSRQGFNHNTIMYQYRPCVYNAIVLYHQRTIDIQSYSVDQSQDPVAVLPAHCSHSVMYSVDQSQHLVIQCRPITRAGCGEPHRSKRGSPTSHPRLGGGGARLRHRITPCGYMSNSYITPCGYMSNSYKAKASNNSMWLHVQ